MNTSPNNLLRQATSFIGRETELAEIATRLADPDHRLLTLIGPGGVGKTRVALQAAVEQVRKSSNGAFFVPLEALSAQEFIAQAIADALNFSLQGEQAPKTQLLNYLREKNLLLVLDNFEHLLDGAAIVSDILQACPDVKILATSREPLNLEEEWVLPIPGMRVPGGEPVTGIEQYSGVQLFLARARRVKPNFSLTAADKPFVVRICQLLGGLPLGIELAAAWVRTLPCADIAQEIERNLDFLSTSLRNVPERQRSMRAALEHSWNLLTEPERQAFRQLAVFRGGFRREAAAQVVGTTLEMLRALVDKSLLYVTEAGRHERHPLVWQYASDKLEEAAGEKETYQDRHSAYYAAFLQQRAADLKGARQMEALKEIDEEIENVRAAWRWMVTRGKVAEIGQSLDCLDQFYTMQYWIQEGEQAFGQAAAALRGIAAEPDAETNLVLGSVLARQGWFCAFQRPSQGRDLSHQSLALLRLTDAPGEIAFVLGLLGDDAVWSGDYAQARRYYQESLALARRSGDRWLIAYALRDLGVLAVGVGDYTEAEQRLQESLAIHKEIGNRRGIAFTLYQLGNAARVRGNLSEAKLLLEECLAVSRDAGVVTAIAMYGLGKVAFDLGEYPEAQRCFQESLATSRELGLRDLKGPIHAHLGDVACALGDYLAAQQHFQEGLQIAMEFQNVLAALYNLIGLANLSAKRGEREHAIELLAHPLRHPAASKEVKDRAERLLAQLARELPAETVTTALERGQAKTVVAVAEEILGIKLPESLAQVFRVPELRIAMDEANIARQVAEITEGEYFQRLQEKADALRFDAGRAGDSNLEIKAEPLPARLSEPGLRPSHLLELIGKQLGAYKIGEPVGIGGMATVYTAFQPSMNRVVAIKVLPAQLAMNPTFLARFQQEAQVIARLEHAHILPVYDYGESEGLVYIVMRYLDGGSLQKRIDAGRIPLRDVIKTVAQIASALDYAHQQGVIHRDIKPSNILFDRHGDCFLADFGIAKIMEGTLDLTGTGVIGTAEYMSPEQGQGLTIDARSDVYSLGVVLYEMLTGRLPYEADTLLGMIVQHATAPLPPARVFAPDLPESIESVLDTALAKQPADRFATAGALAAALDQAIRIGLRVETKLLDISLAATQPSDSARPSGRFALHPRASRKRKGG